MIVKPPHSIVVERWPRLFLAGSIEMGKATDWQARAAELFVPSGFTIFNPRRDDWDPSWEQSIDNPRFVEQVEWELNALEAADFKLFYFEPGTMSPITLLELGLHAHAAQQKIPGIENMAVVCPKGFWRKGNVDIVCRHYGVPMFDTIEAVHREWTPLPYVYDNNRWRPAPTASAVKHDGQE